MYLTSRHFLVQIRHCELLMDHTTGLIEREYDKARIELRRSIDFSKSAFIHKKTETLDHTVQVVLIFNLPVHLDTV